MGQGGFHQCNGLKQVIDGITSAVTAFTAAVITAALAVITAAAAVITITPASPVPVPPTTKALATAHFTQLGLASKDTGATAWIGTQKCEDYGCIRRFGIRGN